MKDTQELVVHEPAPNGKEARELLETEDEIALRELIFQADDIQQREIYVPEWKVTVLLRALNGNERAEFLGAMQRSNMDLKMLYPELVAMTARHPKTKKHIFKIADRGSLMKKAGSAIERLALNAAEMSGLTEAALLDMKKN